MTPSPLAVPPTRAHRLAFLGTPEMAVPPLVALLDAGFEIPLVITRADAKRGRGSGVSPSAVKAAALERGLTVSHRPDDLLDPGLRLDLAVVVAYGRLVKRHILERVPMINIHFSLLPRWRGAAPVERAVLAGDAETGTCLMRVEEGLDTGPVYDRVVVPIGRRVTASELRRQLVDAGTEQLLRCLRSGLPEPVEQAGAVTYAAKIDPAELQIDWSRSADEIDRLVRIGGAWTMFRGKRLRLVDTEPLGTADADAPPGTIGGLDVATGDGTLRLVRVQPEGKTAMIATAWSNGAKPDGQVLGK